MDHFSIKVAVGAFGVVFAVVMGDDMEQNQNTIQIVSTKSDELSLSLSNFNGPLDLLLHLVKEAKIEIKDIFLSEVTSQFLAYMTQLNTLDVDKASEYMEIAATLLEIKSHSLLPVMPGLEDDSSETSEKLLIKRLEEYAKLFKEASMELKELENVDRLYKEPSKEAGNVRFTVKDLSLENLLNAFAGILHKVELRKLDTNSPRQIKKETFSIKGKMIFIKDLLIENDETYFFSLFGEDTTANEVVVTFSALLELMKLQFIKTEQPNAFGDIKIVRNKDITGETIIDYDESN